MILDFESKQIVPTLLHHITKEPRTEAQRPAVIIALYLNKTLYDDNTLSSKQLTGILTDSNIDATNLADAFRIKGREFIKIQGQNYRILPRGIINARELLNSFAAEYNS